MKTFVAGVFAFTALASGALHAQDFAGVWQGTLQVPNGPQLRTVIKISKADSALKATFYSIDQTNQGFPVSAVTAQGQTLKLNVGSGSYEGKMDADGNAITGNFTQGGGRIPLNLKRATPQTEWQIPEAAPVKRMTDASPEFEVATIKPSNPETPGKVITVRSQQLITVNTTLTDLLSFAYGLHAKQLIGAPEWCSSERFDIAAKLSSQGQPDVQQLKTMIQKLLAQRFNLAFHREKKELQAYVITPGKGALKITKSAADPNSLPGLGFRGLGNLVVTNATMGEFADLMQSSVMDRPVVDQTHLTGRWDFTLRWTPNEFQFAGLGLKPTPPSDDPNAPPDLFTAMPEQLGLKMETAKAAVETMVIDKVTMPTAN